MTILQNNQKKCVNNNVISQKNITFAKQATTEKTNQ